MARVTVGTIALKVGGMVTVEHDAENKEIVLTPSMPQMVLGIREAETVSRVVGFLVVAGLDSSGVFHGPNFKKDHPSFTCQLPEPQRQLPLPLPQA